jgi:hypothetical protein
MTIRFEQKQGKEVNGVSVYFLSHVISFDYSELSEA